MTLIEEIVAWSQGSLKDWQRDALRRLLTKPALDDQDMDDLYAMMKTAHGVPDSKNRTPVPLGA